MTPNNKPSVVQNNPVQDSRVEMKQPYTLEDFEFTPIEEMFDRSFNVESTQSIESYRQDLNRISDVFNNITAPAHLSTDLGKGTTVGSNQPLNTNEGFLASINNIDLKDYKLDPQVQDPILSSSRTSGYDRISIHPDFNKLGWNPLIDNEAYYNKNTSGWSDWSRSWAYWADSVGTGFMSGYRSLADFFDGDSYASAPDIESGLAFAEATRLGSSTRGGASGFATNLFLQSGYTFGIIGNIMAEEVALIGLTAVSGGGASPLAALRTAFNLKRLGKLVSSGFGVGRALRASHDILNTLRSADKSKSLYNAFITGGKVVGDIFAPELRASLTALKTGENSVRGIRALAHASTYGGFYRDLRSINMAFSEGKMEGALAYTETAAHNIEKLRALNGGGDLTNDQLSKVHQNALEAATASINFNVPVIYFTNKITLGRTLGGFSPTLRKIFNKNLPNQAKNFVKKLRVVDKKTGKKNTNLFSNQGNDKTIAGSLIGWNKLKSIGTRAGITNTAHGLLRYSAASLGEGLQEVYQEGVANGVVDYYTKLFENPTARRTTLQNHAIRNAINSQISDQGVEVFLSGFLMGGLVQGPQRVLFEKIPEMIRSSVNPEQFREYKDNLEKFEQDVNDIGNRVQEDFYYFDPNRSDVRLQQELDAQQDAEAGMMDQDQMQTQDALDDAAFTDKMHVLRHGTQDLYIEQLEDYLTLSDEELIEVAPQHEADIKSGKARERIQRSIESLKNFETAYNNSFNTIINDAEYKKFEKDTPEYTKAKLRYDAIEHARMLYLFAGDAFEKALARRDSLEETLQASGIMKKLGADDLTVLLNTKNIQQELDVLAREINVLEKAETVDKDQLKDKRRRQIALTAYQVGLESIYDEDAQVYDRDKGESLKKPLLAYLKFLADTKDDFVDENMVDEVIQQLLDHNNLDRRAKIYNGVVALFSNPDKVMDVVNRSIDAYKGFYDTLKASYEKNIKESLSDSMASSVIQDLEKYGIYIPVEQIKEFLETKDINALQNFYNQVGPITMESNPKQFLIIESRKRNYSMLYDELNKTKEATEKEKEENKKAKTAEEYQNAQGDIDFDQVQYEDGFDNVEGSTKDIAIEVAESIKENPDPHILVGSPYAQEILESLYRMYRTAHFNLEKGDFLDRTSWAQSKEGKGAVLGLQMIKMLWFNNLKNKDLARDERMMTYDNDIGFQDWLMENRESEQIAAILAMYPILTWELLAGDRRFQEGLDSIEAILTEEEAEKMEQQGTTPQSDEEGNKLKRKWIAKERGVNILYEVLAPGTDQEVEVYTFTDNSGQQLSAEMLESVGISDVRRAVTPENLAEMREEFQRLVDRYAVDQEFEFDGVQLEYLEEIEGIVDNKVEKFIVLGYGEGNKSNELAVLRYDDRGLIGGARRAATIYISKAGFSEIFSKKDSSFKDAIVQSNMYKLNVADVNGIYPITLGGERLDNKLMSPAMFRLERLVKTLELLTPEELDNATVKIQLNPSREARKLNKNGMLAQGSSENVFIDDVGDKYSILITLDEATKSRIENELKDTEYAYPTDENQKSLWNGDIGFVRNGFYKISDKNGNPVSDVNTLEDSFIEKNLIPLTSSAEDFKKAFGIQSQLLANLDKGMRVKNEAGEYVNVNSAEINFKDFRNNFGIDYQISPGRFDYQTEVKPFSQLDYQTIDGYSFWVVHRKNEDGSESMQIETDHPDPTAFKQSVYAQLKDSKINDPNSKHSNLYDYVHDINSGSFLSVIKTPEGTISVVQARPRSFDQNELDDFYTKLLELADQVQNKEIKDFKVVQSKIAALTFISHPAVRQAFLNVKIRRNAKKKGADIIFEVKIGKGIQADKYSQSINTEDLKDNSDLTKTLNSLNEQAGVKAMKIEVSEKNFRKTFPIGSPVDVLNTETQTTQTGSIRVGRRPFISAVGSIANIENIVGSSVADNKAESVTDAELDEAKPSVEEKEQEIVEQQVPENLVEETTEETPAKSAKELNAERNELIQKKKALRASLRKNKEKGQKARDVEAASPEFQQIIARIAAIDQELLTRNDINNNDANKILEGKEGLEETETLEEFIAWAKQNLPDFISIGDIEDVQRRMNANGITVGMFTMALEDLSGGLNVEGTIYTGVDQPYRYHEAFHAVYRLLLTDKEQAKLRRFAKAELLKKLGGTGAYNKAIAKFKKLHPKYSDLSAKALEDLYLEEYMADEFNKFKTDPRSTSTNTGIKSFFNRIVEWIKSILRGFKKNQLLNLFEKIDSGKYRGGAVQDNFYVRSLFDGVTMDAFKLIPYESTEHNNITYYSYLDPAATEKIAKIIGSLYIDKRAELEEADETLSDREILDDILNSLQELYDVDLDRYDDLDANQLDKLYQISDAVNDYKEEVIDAAQEYLNLVKIKLQNQEESEEQDEQKQGTIGFRNYGKDASERGGMDSVSQRVRMFIAGITLDSKDMFGNTELLNGTSIRIPVDAGSVYNGLMMAGVQKQSEEEILNAMYIFSRRNRNTRAVIDELFNKTGIRVVDDSIVMPKELNKGSAILYNDFINTFKNSRFDYVMKLINKDTKEIGFISAFFSDAANSQMDKWSRRFGDIYENFFTNPNTLEEAKDTLTSLKALFNLKNNVPLTNRELKAKAEFFSRALDENLGIKLSPLYLEISIASQFDDSHSKMTKYAKQLVMLGEGKRLLTGRPTEDGAAGDINIIIDLLGKRVDGKPDPENLFMNQDGGGVVGRLREIAIGNAAFDESVGNTVFKNPDGDWIYAHQKQTWHSKAVGDWNRSKPTIPFLPEDNVEAFEAQAETGQHHIRRVSGLREGKRKDQDANVISEEGNTDDYTIESSKSYGALTSVEFITMLFDLYTLNHNTKTGRNDNIRLSGDRTIAKAPVLLRIMEASNNGDFIDMSVIKAVNDDGSISGAILDSFYNIVQSEFESIKSEFKIVNDNGGQYLGDIVDYNDSEKGTAYNFFKAFEILEDIGGNQGVRDDLIKAAKEGGDITNELRSRIMETVEANLEDMVQQLYALQRRNNIMFSPLVRGKFESNDALELELNLKKNNEAHNIKQIFLNNFINTIAANNLLHGEEARLFKERVINPIKRAKSSNNAIDSVAFDIMPAAADNLGIKHTLGSQSIAAFTIDDPSFELRFTGKGGDTGDRADAQTFMTINGARHTEFGLGNLTGTFAEMLDAIEAGETIDDKFFGKYKEAGAILNSRKFAYADGKTQIKTSTVFLSSEETSYKDPKTGEIKAIPGGEMLHNARLMLEEFERNNEGKIAILVPKSASKMFKSKVLTLDAIASKQTLTAKDAHFIDAENFGRQLINPSNKTEIPLPTQIKALLSSEQNDDVTITHDGQQIKIGDIRTEYHKLLGAGVQFDYTNKYKLLLDSAFIEQLDQGVLDYLEASGEVDLNLMMYIRQAQNNLKTSAAGGNMLSFHEDKDGTPRFELNNTITIQKFEEFFMAYFSKKVMSQKTTGLTLSLKSDFGKPIYRRVFSLDAEGNLDKQKVIRKKVLLKSGIEPKVDIRTKEGMAELQKLLSENPKQSVVVIDRLRYDMPGYENTHGSPQTWTKTNTRYSEAIIPAHSSSVVKNIENTDADMPDVISEMFAVRVPSQDKHSAIYFKVVDFDPVYNGSTGVFPYELIEISGADFDIDKVFASMKDWYYSKKEGFKEYGASLNPLLEGEGKEPSNKQFKAAYSDYIRYVNSKVSEKGSYLFNAFIKATNAENDDPRYLAKPEKKGEFSDRSIIALEQLGLPTNIKAFRDYYKEKGYQPYKAAIDNKLLDQQIALQSNTHVSEKSKDGDDPIAYQPADVEALKELWKKLSAQYPWLQEYVKETGISIDSIIGQYHSHKNVKENSNMIGAVVPPNVIINFLKESGVNINPEFGKITMGNRSVDMLEVDGINPRTIANRELSGEQRRAQYLISNLVTAATDDAKERLLGKLGYAKKAIKLLEVMLAVGIPLDTGTMVLNIPQVREVLAQSSGHAPGLKGLLQDGPKGTPQQVTNENLKKILTYGPIDPYFNLPESLVREMDEATMQNDQERIQDLQVQAEAFNQSDYGSIYKGAILFLLQINTLSNFMDEMISISNLGQGMGKDFADIRSKRENIERLGLYATNAEMLTMTYGFDNAPMPMDLRGAFGINTPSKEMPPHYLGAYLRVFRHFSDQVLPQVFMSETPAFRNIFKQVSAYTKIPQNQRGTKRQAKINKDILGYATIKAYMQELQKNGNAAALASLTNDIIYSEDESVMTIDKVISELRSIFKAQGKRNHFLDFFVSGLSARSTANKLDIHVAMSNSFAKLSEHDKVRIQNGFQELYFNPQTRNLAMSVFHYAMVKDGLQYQYGTLVDAFTPYIMEEYLKASTNAVKAFSGEADFESVFGMSEEELTADFVFNYAESFSHAVNLDTLDDNEVLKQYTDSDTGNRIFTIQETEEISNLTVPLPLFYKSQGSDIPGDYTRYFRLVEATIGDKNVLEGNIDGIVDAERGVYQEFTPKGSISQNPIGFMFDGEVSSRPDRDELFDKVKRESLEYIDPEVPDDIYEFDFTDPTLEIEADEKNIKVNGQTLSKLENRKQPVATTTTTISGKQITYRVDESLQNTDGSKRFASTNVNNEITLNPVSNVQELYDYMEGKEGGITSQQKRLVLQQLESQGYPMSRIKQILSTNKLANSFLLLHEQDHIDNNDRDVYWLNGKDLLTPDKVAIETRATLNALQQLESQQPTSTNNPAEFTNHSGGAIGADSMFDKIGKEYGQTEHKHYYHGKKTPMGNVPLTQEQVNEGIEKAKAAAQQLGRIWKDKFGSLLGRNWFQVKNSDQVIAIAPIVRPGELGSKGFVSRAKRAVVDGGTGYAVEMAIAEGKAVHVFNTKDNSWYTWDGSAFVKSEVPTLAKNFAGIGSRQNQGQMTQESIQAIRDVYEKTFRTEQPSTEDPDVSPFIEDAGQPTQQAAEVKSIPMQPDNVSKILSGQKTTTLRTNNLPSGVYNIGGQQFNLTNRGLLSIEEAGGVEAINKSEAFAESGPKFSSTKDFLAGKRKLYVYDITPVQPTQQQSSEVTQRYLYYGATYAVQIDENGRGIDVVGYKGKKANKEKLLAAFNNNPNVDPQTGRAFETVEKVEKTEDSKKKEVTLDDLNEGQKKAYNEVLQFLNTPTRRTHSLIGYAGTGKTTLLNLIRKEINPFERVIFSSPTHRANSVMKLKMPNERVMTLHSLLGLRPDTKLEDFDARNASYEMVGNVSMPSILIIDESSMINDNLFGFISDTFKNIKILFVGDDAQLKPVKQAKASKALTSTEAKSVLTEVMRADNANLLEESMHVRNEGGFTYETNLNAEDKGVEFIQNPVEFDKMASAMFESEEFTKDPLLLRVVGYTNAEVEEVNKQMRLGRYGRDAAEYEVNEIIMGYSNWGTDYQTKQPKLANGGDYKILEVTPETRRLGTDQLDQPMYREFEGYQIKFQNLLNPKDRPFIAFVLSKDNSIEDFEFLAEVDEQIRLKAVALGKKDRGSAAAMWRLKDEFKKKFITPVDIQRNGRTKIAKTLDYGYAHTIHKSQGGTYKNIFVLDAGINKADKQSASQLRYVAVTRAESKAVILHGNTVSQQPSDEYGINDFSSGRVDEDFASLGLQQEVPELGNLVEEMREAANEVDLQRLHGAITATEEFDEAKMKEAGIDSSSLETLTEAFRQSKFVEARDFAEHLKNCYKKT